MSQETNYDLDSAIEEAGRRLTAIEPCGVMASRVAAHLGERRQRGWQAPVFAAVASVTAGIAIVMFLQQRPVAPQVTTITSVSRQPVPVVPTAPTVTVDPARATASRPPVRSVRARASTQPAPPSQPSAVAETEEAVDAAWRARAIPALAEPERIAAEVSQPDPIDLPLLQLKPLETKPLRLARLDGGGK